MWALGAVFTGVSFNYGWLLFARIFTGAGEAPPSIRLKRAWGTTIGARPRSPVHQSDFPCDSSLWQRRASDDSEKQYGQLDGAPAGEASVMTLTGPFIDDVAPPASKARWFAWLSLTPTLGVAIGYKLGDLTQYMSWRVLFYIEAGVAVPVVLFCLLAPAVRLRGKRMHVQPEGELATARLCVPCRHAPERLGRWISGLYVWPSPASPRNSARAQHEACLARTAVVEPLHRRPAMVQPHEMRAGRICTGGKEQVRALVEQHGRQAEQKKASWWQRCGQGTRELWGEVRMLHRQPMYLANNWGFVPVQAAIGVFTFWGPKVSLLHA